MDDDKLPCLVLVVPVIIAAAAAAFIFRALGRRRARFAGLKSFLDGVPAGGPGTYLSLFFGSDTPVFCGVRGGNSFSITENSVFPDAKGGLKLGLAATVDVGFRVIIAAPQSGQTYMPGSDIGDMRGMRPGLWAENYEIRTDNGIAAAEFFSAENVQQAVHALLRAGYTVRLDTNSLTASCWLDPWKDPAKAEAALLSEENLCPALDALAAIVQACGKLTASPQFP